MADPPHYLGHRSRLRQRFLKDLGAGFSDYELIELVLFMAKPRGDTKPLAKALLKRFGSFAETIAADPAEIAKVPGAGAATAVALKSIEAAAVRLTRDNVMGRPAISSWQMLLDYCHASMARAPREQFRVLFLDRKNVLMADEIQQTGTVDHTPVYPREVVRRALELGASAIIMVHNHPSGDPTPSAGDVEMTRDVKEAAHKLGIQLHDHIIIGRTGHSSLKNMGLI